MLKVTYEVDQSSYAAKMIVEAAHKVNKIDIGSCAKEYKDFLDILNSKLQEAFEEGRDFQRRYKEEDDA